MGESLETLFVDSDIQIIKTGNIIMITVYNNRFADDTKVFHSIEEFNKYFEALSLAKTKIDMLQS